MISRKIFEKLYEPNIHIALIHYPVVNKNGDVIASAVTNLDMHDIARVSRTFGVRSFFVITPLEDQIELAHRIASHWKIGAGSEYNPKRKSAIELIKIVDTLESAVNDITAMEGQAPQTVATCATASTDFKRFIRFEALRKQLSAQKPYLLMLGTAWGLTREFIAQADYVLESIVGNSDYNHLSVRSAASIMLDRLIGPYYGRSNGDDDAHRPESA